MKAAVLKEFGTPLVIEDLPDPVLGTGEVIVDVVAAGVLPYMAEVLSGKRKYMMTLPMAPGAGAAVSARLGLIPPGSRSASGWSAIRRCARATMQERPISLCRD